MRDAIAESELQSIERLQKDEAALDVLLATARRESEARVGAARQEVVRLQAAAAASLESLLADRRAVAAAEREAAATTLRDSMREAREAVCGAAQARRSEAIALIAHTIGSGVGP